MINIACLGLNHRVAPVSVREKLWFSEDDVRSLLCRLKAIGVEESVLISTCNRTELYYVPPANGLDERAVWKVLASQKNADEEPADALYAIHSLHAAQHLFKLAAGADSMILGDVQILNQIKSAYALAQSCRTTGTLLNKLFHAALHTGKRARTETEIGDGAVSVGYAAAELASKIFQDLHSKTALLIGAGETGELTAQHLKSHGLGTLLIANRTRERADQLCAKMNGTAVDFGAMASVLPGVDIIISSVSAPGYILNKADLDAVKRERGSAPLFVIDIGVPRNVDPAVGLVAGVFLHDVDSLQQIIDRNLERRRAEIPRVREIVFEELVQFDHWHGSLELNPTIQQLREQFEQIRQSEVEKFSHHFTADRQDDVALLTKRIVNKILHTPMVTLKGDPGRGHEVQKEIRLVRALFGLDA
jgi:glutamyl-tRNA reductase